MNNKRMGYGSRGWVLIVQMFLSFFACFAIANAVNIIAPFKSATAGWDATFITSCYTIGGVITFALQMLINKTVARRSAKKGALLFSIIFIAAVIIMGLSTNQWMFAILFIIMKIAADMWCLIENGILVGQWFPRRKGIIMGVTTFGIPLASGMGMAIMGQLIGKSMLISFMPFIVAAVISVLLQQVFLADYPEDVGCYRDNDASLSIEDAKAEIEREKLAKQNSPWTIGVLLGTKEFWFVILPISFLLFGSIGIMTQVTSILMSIDTAFYEQYGTLVLTAISFVACFGSWLCGFMDTKLGTKKAVIITCVLMVVTGAIAMIGSLPAILISCAFMAIFMGGGSNYTVSAAMEFWGFSDFSAVYSYVSPVCSMLGALGPMVIAILAASTGGYTIGFGVIAVMGVIGTVMINLVDSKRVAEKTAALKKSK